MSELESDATYREIYPFQINNELYQVQLAEFEDEKFFFIKRSGKIVCMIMQNERNEWEADCDISQELFEQITKWINKLY